MFEIFLLTQMSCKSLANQVIEPNNYCTELSSEVKGVSSSIFVSDDPVRRKSYDMAYSDESISLSLGTKTRSSFFVSIDNNDPSNRIVPSYVSYDLIDENGNIFGSGVYSVPPIYGDMGIVRGGDRTIRVEFTSEERREYRNGLTGNYSVQILSVGYQQSRFR